ncbi:MULTISPECIES: hypothetical protein [unclassified Mesorhizobium]|nr:MULTISPECIES: hypothetical protein [unclassified Mesorhizobium]
MSKSVAVITGASQGIGWATAIGWREISPRWRWWPATGRSWKRQSKR